MSVGAANALLDATTVAGVKSEHPGGERKVALVEQARRMGPLRYSALGRRAEWRPPPSAALVEWFVGSLDRWWLESGCPDPYPVVDVGAGDGTLARDVLALGPRCLDALRYVLVEPDGMGTDVSSRIVIHGRGLPIEAPSLLFPPGLDDPDDPDDRPPPARQIGPLLTSLAELPRLAGWAVVAAIGWLERLPVDLVQWHEGAWSEVRLAARDDDLVEMLVPLADPVGPAGLLGRWAASGPEEGDRFAVRVGATDWLSDALRCAESGLLVICGTWSESTGANDGPDVLALDQLVRVRRPLRGGPERLAFSESAVTWRLG